MAQKAKKAPDDTESIETEEEIVNPPEIDSKYRMIILAAQRSKQLQRGATPRVDADPHKTKPTRIAIREFEEKKVDFTFDE